MFFTPCFSHHVFLSLESRVVLVSTVVPRHKGSEHLKYSQSELRCAVREKIHTGVQKLNMKKMLNISIIFTDYILKYSILDMLG